ncbi:MAG: DUF4360 domain-containing protein [Nostoc sp. NOS(2021)]|uniref:DUF4360 domain-containing protein n=1 Tax=Nostoc sp. NOS(2021) TaxID=2815407 RepID=UPI0025CBA2BE|nr:DUF4360 domain-containing protein [Nostoc sp. NOS(2021)]MBN3896404.1 DUF4360 domain-containing protein [Nostoc sp. NOS(2021)]
MHLKVQAQPQEFEFQIVPVTLVVNGCPPGIVQVIWNRDTLSIDLLHKCLNCHVERSETSVRFLSPLRSAQNDIPDFLTFTRGLITFSDFEALASPPKVVSKSCNLLIGLNVPSGFNVQPIKVKYIGFADVPKKGSADLDVINTLSRSRNSN